MKHYIYILVDPEDELPKYVGQTINPRARFIAHYADCGNDGKHEWLHKLRARGLRPRMMIVDSCDDAEDISRRETWWILHLLEHGLSLFNLTFPGVSKSDFKVVLAKIANKSLVDPNFNVGIYRTAIVVEGLALLKCERCDGIRKKGNRFCGDCSRAARKEMFKSGYLPTAFVGAPEHVQYQQEKVVFGYG